jgi:hypothetical protein
LAANIRQAFPEASMRRAWTAWTLTALLALSACSKSDTEADKKDDKDSGPGISLTAEQSKSLGLASVAAQSTSYHAQASGYGVVMALDAIGQTDADVVTAQAAATQSSAAAARARDLSTGADAAVSRETYEAAESKASADQAALALAIRKRDAAFGLHAPWRDSGERAAIMARLQSGETVLVRVTFPLGIAATPKTLTISRVGTGGKSWNATTVWEAPADPALPGHGMFALVDGSDLAQGERVIAQVPIGAPQNGVVVPATALVISDGENWVYLENGDNHYLRTRIDISKPEGEGYFVAAGSGIAPGAKVVTSGAGLLLSREINPSTDTGD